MLRQAEKITGLVISEESDGFYKGIGEDGEFWVHARDSKDAAFRICELHWQDVCKVVMRRQGYKCLLCAKLAPLSVHHVKLRSHGRRDRPSDLQALCSSCHSREHGIKVSA